MSEFAFEDDFDSIEIEDVLDKWNIDTITRKLKQFPDITRKKRRKIMRQLLLSPKFMEFLFKPNMKDQKAKTLVMDQVSALYEQFIKPVSIIAILDVIEKEGYTRFTQTQATFFNSITSMAVEEINESLRKIDVLKSKKELSRSEAESKAEKINEYSKYVSTLMKKMHKCVGDLTKKITKATGLSANYADIFVTNNPESKYIDKYKIGFYLNNTLQLIYEEASEHGIPARLYEEDWRRIFSTIYGSENVAECATFILLEGAGRLSKYEDSEAVRDIWNSLTAFALAELNNSPERLRDQMVDLYIKRIDKMFQNGAKELRVDMTKLDNLLYPKLSESINKHLEKIQEIFKR